MHLVTFERRILGDGEELDPLRGGIGSMGSAALGLEALEFTTIGARRLGALIQLGPHAGSIVDLNRAFAVQLACDDVGAPEAEADSLLPPEIGAFLHRLPDSLERAREALRFVTDALDRYDAPDVVRAGLVEPRRRVRVCAPVPRPGKVVAVLGNYPSPSEPELFLEAPSAVIGPEDEIVLPSEGALLDCAGTLAVVIGRTARNIGVGEATAHVAGYCAANDVMALDLPGQRGAGLLRRSCDTFLPLGPALVTADEVSDPQALAIRTAVSGEPRSSVSTKEMRCSVAQLVSIASELMTLDSGDVLLTGAPDARKATDAPARPLRDGDVVEVEIERVGRIWNHVSAKTSSRRGEAGKPPGA